MLADLAHSENPEMTASLMEAARLCAVSYPTMLRWRDNGQIQTLKKGGRYVVPMSEIVRLQGKTMEAAHTIHVGKVEKDNSQALDNVTRALAQLNQNMESFMKSQQELATLMVHNTRVLAKRLAAVETILDSVRTYTTDIADGRSAMIELAKELKLAKRTLAAAVHVSRPELPGSGGIHLSARALVEVEEPPPEEDDIINIGGSSSNG